MICAGEPRSQMLHRMVVLQLLFMHLKLRRGCKEDYVETGESKAGIGSHESGYVLLGGVRKAGSLIRAPPRQCYAALSLRSW